MSNSGPISATPSKPPQAPKPAPPTPPPATFSDSIRGTTVNMHGIPPKPNMAPTKEHLPEDALTDATAAEIEAGKTSLATHKRQAQDEYDFGAKMVARYAARASK